MDASTVLVIAALVAACVDWLAVASLRPNVESVAKPLVMVLLIAAAITSSTLGGGTRWLVAVGLFFGLIGDIMLLPRVDAFLSGLGAFLVGHVLYIIGFSLLGIEAIWTALGLIIAAVLLVVVGTPIARSLRGSKMLVPVGVYIGVIAAMVAVAIGTGKPLLAMGAVVFALSDALLGHDRFVTPEADRRVVVHMLYHLGQMGFVVVL